MGPIACLRVVWCFVSDLALLNVLRRTCCCGGHENQNEHNQDAFHDRNLASDAAGRKTCLKNAVTIHMDFQVFGYATYQDLIRCEPSFETSAQKKASTRN